MSAIPTGKRHQCCTKSGAALVLATLVSIATSRCLAKPAQNNHQIHKVSVVYSAAALKKGEAIVVKSLNTKVVNESACPSDAVQNDWIAIGRHCTNDVEKDQPIRLNDVLPEGLASVSIRKYIYNLQGNNLYRRKQDLPDHNELIPVIRSTRNIPAGSVIKPNDLKVGTIRLKNCPGDALGDAWIAVGRVTNHPIESGETIYYHSVIPTAQWNEWKRGE